MKLFILLFIAGIAAGALPVMMYYEAKEDRRAKVEAESALAQEKENERIVSGYANAIVGVSDWYRAHPVRVRIQSHEGSPECAAPDPEDVLLDLFGPEASHGRSVDP